MYAKSAVETARKRRVAYAELEGSVVRNLVDLHRRSTPMGRYLIAH